MFRATNFDKLLDKATSNLRLDPDWPTIIQICDLIRQNDCSPKYAVTAVKKKLYSQNPHQAMFALLTLESIVKNCGSGIHDEVASKAFCETLRDLVKTTQHENLRNKILELIQAWAFAFRNTPKYRAVQDTVNILKAECFKFPPLKESDAMFSADTAPEWADGEVCHRCRVAFSLMVRRHHCRACGQVFCQQCSAKTSTLPKFGIEKEVRVCDACFDKVSRPPTSTAKLEIVDTSDDYGPTQGQKRPGKSAEELQEEEELQLALALSQSEAEQKEKERKSRTHIAPDPIPHQTLSPTPSSVSASPEHSGAGNAELSRYLDRNYWEQRLSRDASAAPTAPASNASHDAHETEYIKPTNKAQEDDNEDKEIDEFVESLKSQVEIFVNRMKSNSSRGRSIANDTSVQTLFMNITAMHSRLLRYIQQQDDKRVYLESLQDKVSQVRDSRAALDTLRAEHAARLAAAAEAAERQRQLQMAAKLQAMRKKKHEYLQYQRQLALQRVQEQEREMQMRQEQQKHQYMMSASGGYYMPAVSMHQFQASGYPNQPIYGKQFHMPGMPQSTTDGSLSMPGQTALSQANMPMNVTQVGTISQSMPQLANTYSMSTPAMTQPQVTAQPINQNLRPSISHQLPMQPVAMHQHPMQMGIQHQQSQMMPNLPPQQMNPTNPMLGMQMRMPVMQGNQVPAGYPMNMQNQQTGQQPAHMMMPLSGQQSQGIGMPNHIPSTSQNLPQGPQAPQAPQALHSQGQHLPQNQPMTMHGQAVHQPGQVQGQQMHPQQNQNVGQHGQILHQGQLSHQLGAQVGQMGQQMPPQMQTGQIPMQHPQGQMQMPQNQQVAASMPQNQQVAASMPQNHQIAASMPQNHQVAASMPQNHQVSASMPQNQQPLQNQQMSQAQGQVLKMQPQNFSNAPPQSGPQQQASQQSQQVQTPVKSENNNNTAELISFD